MEQEKAGNERKQDKENGKGKKLRAEMCYEIFKPYGQIGKDTKLIKLIIVTGIVYTFWKIIHEAELLKSVHCLNLKEN